jgi:hypothetical protein
MLTKKKPKVEEKKAAPIAKPLMTKTIAPTVVNKKQPVVKAKPQPPK